MCLSCDGGLIKAKCPLFAVGLWGSAVLISLGFFFHFGQAVSQVNDPSSLSSTDTEMAAVHVCCQGREYRCWQIEVLTYNSRGRGQVRRAMNANLERSFFLLFENCPDYCAGCLR